MKLHSRCILSPPQVGSRATRLILQVLVHEANIQDDRGGKLFLAPLKEAFPRLKLIWANSGYKKEGFCEWGKRDTGVGGREGASS